MSFIAVTVEPDCGIDDAEAHAACQAVDTQAREFAAAWGVPYTPVLYFSPDVLTKLADDELAEFVADARLLTVQLSLDAPGALGYHDEVNGVIFARVKAGPEWSVTLSHEVLEEMGDPTCDAWAPWSDGTQALEACDRVEGDTYRVQGVLVSNYLLPSAFVEGNAGPWDKLGQLAKWDGLTGGGYVIVRDAAGNETDVFAETAHATARAEEKRVKPGGRTARRLAAPMPEYVAPEPARPARKRRAA